MILIFGIDRFLVGFLIYQVIFLIFEGRHYLVDLDLILVFQLDLIVVLGVRSYSLGLMTRLHVVPQDSVIHLI